MARGCVVACAILALAGIAGGPGAAQEEVLDELVARRGAGVLPPVA